MASSGLNVVTKSPYLRVAYTKYLEASGPWAGIGT